MPWNHELLKVGYQYIRGGSLSCVATVEQWRQQQIKQEQPGQRQQQVGGSSSCAVATVWPDAPCSSRRPGRSAHT